MDSLADTEALPSAAKWARGRGGESLMRFRVVRASEVDGQIEPPVAGAVAGELNRFGKPEWLIQLTGIDELVALIERLGESVVVRPPGRGDFPKLWPERWELMVYDDYIE